MEKDEKKGIKDRRERGEGKGKVAKRKKQQRDCFSPAFACFSPRASSRPEYDSAARHLRWTGSVYS